MRYFHGTCPNTTGKAAVFHGTGLCHPEMVAVSDVSNTLTSMARYFIYVMQPHGHGMLDQTHCQQGGASPVRIFMSSLLGKQGQ